MKVKRIVVIKKLLVLGIVLLNAFTNTVSSANITIIESQSYGIGQHKMDTMWQSTALQMGHMATVVPQNTLNNTAFFATTDVLIVSSGALSLSNNKLDIIIQFIKTGKSVYLQGEYDKNHSNMVGFVNIIDSLGGQFKWTTTGAAAASTPPIYVTGTYGTTPYDADSICVNSSSFSFYYPRAGKGDCNTIPFVTKNSKNFGFHYIPSNNAWGTIMSIGDQDWVNVASASGGKYELMGNLITHLLFPNMSNMVDLGNDTTICPGETVLLDAYVLKMTYIWSDNSTDSTLLVTQPGTYWVGVTTASNSTFPSGGCTFYDTINVFMSPAGAVNLGNDTALCLGQTIMLDAGTTGPYLWSDGTTNSTLTITTNGQYWVEVGTGMCKGLDTINVAVSQSLNATITATGPFCPNDPIITLNAVDAGGTWSGTGITNGTTGTFDPATAGVGSHTITYTITGSCGDVGTIDIIITPNITPTFTPVAAICSGGALAALPITSNNTITGTWTPAINNTTTTVYTFTPDAGQCATDTTLTITVLQSNTSIDTQTACGTYTWIDGNSYIVNNNMATVNLTNVAGCDSVVTLNLTISNFSASTMPVTACDNYIWIDGNTYTTSNNTATFTYIGGSVNGCDSIVTLNLIINNSSTSSDVQMMCDSYTWIDGNTYTANNNTATVTLTNATGCDSVVTLNLTINNSSSSTDTQVACDTYTWIDGNTYTANNNTATVTLTNALGCDSVIALNLTINQNTIPIFNSIPPICADEAISPIPTTSNNGITGSWSPALNNTITTTYTFTPNASECATNTTLTITVNPIVTPTFSEVSPICIGEVLSSLPTTSSNNISGSWSPNLDNTTTTTYTFTPTVIQQCTTNTSLTINVHPNPIALFNFGPQPATTLDPTIYFTDLSTDADQWSWDFSGLGFSNYQNPSYTFSDTGSFVVSLLVTSEYGCTHEVAQIITITDAFNIYIPNSFTPNGDGNNDMFIPIVTGYEPGSAYSFTVFNRWGEIIFQTTELTTGWDGKYKGKLPPIGVYVWRIEIKDSTLKTTKNLTGHVNILHK